MEIYRVFSELDSQATSIPENPWVIRLEFDRRKIIDNKITMEDINQVLKLAFPQSGMMFMDDNAAKLVFRMRISFQSTAGQVDDDLQYLKDKIEDIGNVVIKGVDGINSVLSGLWRTNEGNNDSIGSILVNTIYIASNIQFSIITTLQFAQIDENGASWLSVWNYLINLPYVAKIYVQLTNKTNFANVGLYSVTNNNLEIKNFNGQQHIKLKNLSYMGLYTLSPALLSRTRQLAPGKVSLVPL
jgi:hypothetical protein